MNVRILRRGTKQVTAEEPLEPPGGTISREEPVRPSFLLSGEGAVIQLWRNATGGYYLKTPGVAPVDLKCMYIAGISNPWNPESPPIKLALENAGLFMNALHTHNKRLEARQEEGATEK
ncbi:hypothetical protein COT77_01050 [Candidatus Berkelbacteria bacterium CG10_big_fil_rev_8_21_14_0_10_41_12]|uniref:Uncharacterized protein n=1 Tax=Candidatus Berkelbacteria bacterium CG10_big_fil_rev_8_21_14_0_10_41_12 TaxID=1974513 RepID=A0A2M6WXI4_9BACT|nr:MAG: hypothetical protein COT77_01050 [Candidatus Berkelbacteria bacterium CG10_big_fil_rev_8_21_14_0_10_41_12]